MERTTTEITLPKSGARVIFYSNITTGDKRKIRQASFASMKMNMEAKVKEMSAEGVVIAEEIALMALVKEIVTKDGLQVGNIRTFIDGLSVEDGDLIYAEVDKITNGSTLTLEQKKN